MCRSEHVETASGTASTSPSPPRSVRSVAARGAPWIGGSLGNGTTPPGPSSTSAGTPVTEGDLDTVASNLAEVVGHTMRTMSVSLWLAEASANGRARVHAATRRG
jgi:hypothetical protein